MLCKKKEMMEKLGLKEKEGMGGKALLIVKVGRMGNVEKMGKFYSFKSMMKNF